MFRDCIRKWFSSGSHIKQQGERRDLFVVIRSVMCTASTYPLSLGNENVRFINALKMFDLCYEIFNYFACGQLIISYLCTTYIFYKENDLENTANGLLQAIIYIWAILMKVYFRRIQPNLVNEIMQFINWNYQTTSARGFTYVTMTESIRASNKLTKVMAYSFYMAVLFSIAMTIYTGNRSLPMTSWYPFDYRQPIVYEFIFLLQAWSLLQVAAAFATSSGLYMCLSILMSGQYDILFCSLKNVLATTYLNMGASRQALSELQDAQSAADGEVNQYNYASEYSTSLDQLLRNQSSGNSKDFQTAFKSAFLDCLHQHRFILTTLKQVEKLFHPIWFLKLFEVTVMLCLMTFVVVKSSSSNSFSRLLVIGEYLIMATYEVFTICYFAEKVHQSSQRCGDALWRSPWNLHLQQVRSDYLFFFLNSQKHFQFTAGKLYNLNMGSFNSIIRSAFSAFTILRNLDFRS